MRGEDCPHEGAQGAPYTNTGKMPVPQELDAMTDNPETRLIVYGSLAPGEVNDFMLAGLSGEWYPCRIRGWMGAYLGFKSFRYDPQGPEPPAWLVVRRPAPDVPSWTTRGGGIRTLHHPGEGQRRLGQGPGLRRQVY